MFYDLNEKQQSWADFVFDSLTMEEKVAQLLHPNFSGQSESDLQELFQKVPIGSFFTGTQDFEVLRKRHEIIQKNSKVPVLISADMENGTNMIKDKSILFPTQMGMGACGNPEYAYMMGKITARLSRCAGVNTNRLTICTQNTQRLCLCKVYHRFSCGFGVCSCNGL